MKMSFTKNHIFSATALESEAARKTLRQILQKSDLLIGTVSWKEENLFNNGKIKVTDKYVDKQDLWLHRVTEIKSKIIHELELIN